jgi:putative sigma-54 modulation protein
MLIEITARHQDLDDSFKSHVEQRVEKLAKFFERLMEARVVFGVEGHNKTAEIMLYGNRVVLKGRGMASDERTALDEALKNVERRLRKHKDRLLSKRDLGPPIGVTASKAAEFEETMSRNDTGHKMSIEDAVAEMDEKGLSFRVFINASTDKKSLIYRLENGDYGLIEPEG